jgi:hypothetical protein
LILASFIQLGQEKKRDSKDFLLFFFPFLRGKKKSEIAHIKYILSLSSLQPKH